MMHGRYEEARTAYEDALELAREVGAHAEAPFLIARLAELSYHAGDLDAARKGLDEAEAEAERQHVLDAHVYVHFLRATVALAADEIPQARRYADLACGAEAYGEAGPRSSRRRSWRSRRASPPSNPRAGPSRGCAG